MEGHQYEYQCAKMLKKKGFSKVKVTKGSGDQGIDIIAYSGDKKYGIQCKYYSSPVGNHAVQEVFAGAKYYDCDVAVVMTNNTFTPSARALSRKTGVLLWENNKIPRSFADLGFGKVMGMIAFYTGVLGFVMLYRTEDEHFPTMQEIEFIMLAIGGAFSMLERKKWRMAIASGVFYLIAAGMNRIFSLIGKGMFGYDFLLFAALAVISFLRADYLRKKATS